MKAKKRLEVASRLKLSLAERAYVIKACVSAAFFYVARVAGLRHFAARKNDTLLFSFLWGRKTGTVARALLRLPFKGALAHPTCSRCAAFSPCASFLTSCETRNT